MKKTVFLFSGEGARSAQTGLKLLQQAPCWQQIKDTLDSELNLDLETVWKDATGNHRCPNSALLTVVSQICLADIWRQWGYDPDVTVGHSTGELCAAYQAGLYSLADILQLAYRIGEVAANLNGTMLHGTLSDKQITQLPVHISSYNFNIDSDRHVTVSDYADKIDAFWQGHPDFVKMRLPHPWHHPDYGRFVDRLPRIISNPVEDGTFLSGVTTAFETRLEDDHWQRWLVNPIDFIKTMQTLDKRFGGQHLEIIEIGFHPVLKQCCQVFKDHAYVSSMFRGEDDVQWIVHQRKKLDPAPFRRQLKQRVDAYRPDLQYGLPLAYQGFDSLKFTELAVVLQPCFLSLSPQDFYRYKTLNDLIDRFGSVGQIELPQSQKFQGNDVVIAGVSCRLPAAVETPTQFWDMLISKTDQVSRAVGRGASESGFLDTDNTHFDHQYFGIAPAEANTMDPQQILALELTEMLWRDAGIDPATLPKNRVGVYMGTWSQEYFGDRTSVYYPTGTNPSIVASRISYHYDLRGPSWVSNTACSSSLVAVHYAAKDIEAGRVDYAIAGGVNMLLNEEFTTDMRNAGFLSSDNRCKAFDESANGYVRAEGGGLVLLVNKALVDKYYAELTGSAINQNGGRSQVITAPHPEAQEELITAACQDAGIRPQEIAYLESHGTGTKIGDPVEMSAIQNTVAKNRTDTCYVGSVKSNIGHLESAAGIAGLIKAVAVLNHGVIPPNLHFKTPNQHIDFESFPIRIVSEATPIDQQANVGVSSFGFGGSNAHIIMRGAEADVRKTLQPIEVPFDRQRAAPITPYLRLNPSAAIASEPVPPADNTISATVAGGQTSQTDILSREAVSQMIHRLFYELTQIEEIDPEIELTDQGLDSMSGTELISQLEESLQIELGPEILFEFPLKEQFVDEIYRLAAPPN